jgi:hypothetical protein
VGPFKIIPSRLSIKIRKSIERRLIGTIKADLSKKEILGFFQPKIARRRKNPGRKKTKGIVRMSFIKSRIIYSFLIN